MLSKASLDLVTSYLATNEASLRASIDTAIKGLTEEKHSVFKVAPHLGAADTVRGGIDAVKAFQNKLGVYKLKGFTAANVRRILGETANSLVPSTKGRVSYLKTPSSVLGMAWYLKREFLEVLIPEDYHLTDVNLSARATGAIKPDHLTRAVVNTSERNIRYLSRVDREISLDTPMSIILGLSPRVVKTPAEETRFRMVFDDSMYGSNHLGSYTFPAECISSKEQFDTIFKDCLMRSKAAVLEALRDKALSTNGWYSTGHFLNTKLNGYVTAATRDVDAQAIALRGFGNTVDATRIQREAVLRKGIYMSLSNVFTALLSVEDSRELEDKRISKFVGLIKSIHTSNATAEVKEKSIKDLIVDFGQTNMMIRILGEEDIQWDFLCSLSTSTYSGHSPGYFMNKYSEPNLFKWSLKAYGLEKGLPNAYSSMDSPRAINLTAPTFKAGLLGDTIGSTFKEFVVERKEDSAEILKMLEDTFTANEINEIYPLAKATKAHQERLLDIGYKVTLSILTMAVETMLERRFGEE